MSYTEAGAVRYGELLDYIACYQIKNEGAKVAKSRDDILDALETWE